MSRIFLSRNSQVCLWGEMGAVEIPRRGNGNWEEITRHPASPTSLSTVAREFLRKWSIWVVSRSLGLCNRSDLHDPERGFDKSNRILGGF